MISQANGAFGAMTGASLAVSMIGESLAQVRGLLSKHAIKQVDRLLTRRSISCAEKSKGTGRSLPIRSPTPFASSSERIFGS